MLWLFVFLKTKSSIIFICFFLGNNIEQGEAPAVAWNTAGLGHETWPRGGRRCVLAAWPASCRKCVSSRTHFLHLIYAILTSPPPHYCRRTKEHCRIMVAAKDFGLRPRLSAAVVMQLCPRGYGPRGVVSTQDGSVEMEG